MIAIIEAAELRNMGITFQEIAAIKPSNHPVINPTGPKVG
jgi:hypothetical protein